MNDPISKRGPQYAKDLFVPPVDWAEKVHHVSPGSQGRITALSINLPEVLLPKNIFASSGFSVGTHNRLWFPG